MTAPRVVLPGSWYAVLGSGAIVLLPPQEKRRVPVVWALADDGAGFDEILDALIADGLRDLSGFALVSNREGDVRVVIRGGVTAVCDTPEGEVRVAGATAATWAERDVRRVNGLRVEVDDERSDALDDEEMLSLGDGVARARAVIEPAVVQPLAAAPPAAPPPEPEPAREPEPEPAPEPPPEPPPEEAVTEHVPEQPAPAGGPVARLVVSHGETVDVDRPVLLGRAPEGDASEVGDPRLVALPSPSREISGTHLEIRPGSGPDVGSAVVTDLGSTNGTVVTLPGTPPEELQAGVACRLVPGAVVDLGDGISIEVVEP